MKKTCFLHVVLFALASIFFIPVGVLGQNNTPLFKLVGKTRAGASAELLSVAAVRQQPIQIRTDAIDSPMDTQIEIPVLDGSVYRAVQRETEGFVRRDADTFTWNGKIYGDGGFEGDVILTVHKDAMCGLIYTPSGVYDITPQANGSHVLVQIDQSLFPDEHPNNYENWLREDIIGNQSAPYKNLPGQIFTNQPASPSVDNGSQIDVMIVYTTAVKNALGGTTQADAFAAQAVATTNTAYANSGITPRIRLVRSQEVTYNEEGTLSAALTFVKGDATIAAARNTYKADAVGIIINAASDGCGLASLMANGNNNQAFESQAFSATLQSCAVDNLSFPHELGHNQGANHNPADAGTTPAQAVFPYAFGHCVTTGADPFRSVMSYAGTECGTQTPRVAYFSNPLAIYMTQPTGTADRNNALTINNTALTVSQFRDSGLAPTAANVIIGGRVVNSSGRALSGVTILMNDASGNVKTAVTTPFGYYSFSDVPSGATYVVSARSKRFSFAQQSQVINVLDDMREVNFVGYPSSK